MRTALRFVSGAELAGAFRAADLVVLPYREIDQSGVLFTALAFGKPLLLTPSAASRRSTGAAARPARRPGRARRRRSSALLDDPDAAGADGRRLTRAADGPYGWDAIARRTLELYAGAPGVDRVVGRGRRPPGAARAARSPVSRKPVRSATRCESALSSWMSSSISSQPELAAPPSRAAASTARVATPLPRASLATQ